MKLIVAVNNLGYIGINGEIPWKSKADFKHFKSTTMGGILIVGQTTFEEDLKGRTLPGRSMYVVGDQSKGYNSLWGAVEKAVRETIHDPYYHAPITKTSLPVSYRKQIWVIGGQSIYEQLLPLVEELHISYINDNTVGDRKFNIPEKFRGKIFTYNFEPDESK